MTPYNSDHAVQGVGLVVKSNSQLDKEEIERDAEEQQNKPVIIGLASYVRKCYQDAKAAKATIENEMQDCLRMRRGEYDQTKLTAIQEMGGSTIYMRLVDEKCVAAESWLKDIIINQQDKPWGIKPTPVPDINPVYRMRISDGLMFRLRNEINTGIVTDEMFEQAVKETEDMLSAALNKAAKEAAQKLEVQIEDILIEGGFYDVLKELMYDITTYHNAFIKAPIIRFRNKLKWENGRLVPKKILSIEFDRPSPLDIYPSPSSIKINDGYIIEHHRFLRSELYALIGVKGYNDTSIRAILNDSNTANSSTAWMLDDSVNIENDKTDTSTLESSTGKIDALQFWGEVSGAKLIEYGMPETDIPDKDAEYSCEVWLVGNYVIKAAINPDKLGRSPYSTASFRSRPGSFWGESLAWILKDTQDMCNSAARNLVNNMAISSGPQVGVDSSSIPAGEDITKIYPWKIWQFNKPQGQPVWFFQPNSLTAELLNIYKFFSEEADNKSGIPKYSYGSGQTSGALSTATGFTMMLNNATRGIKAVVLNIDDVVKDVVKRLFQWKMIYQPFDYNGDAQIEAKGSSALIAKEQTQVRRQELLNIMLNPVIMNIVGEEGIAELLRGVINGADLDGDKIIPSVFEMQKAAKARTIQQQEQQGVQPATVNQAGQLVSGQEVALFGGTRG